jgi:exodeoxyribonuclease V alpha subunit
MGTLSALSANVITPEAIACLAKSASKAVFPLPGPASKHKTRFGDRVIQTENNYNRDVFNGDLGVIEKINRIEQVLHVDFEGRSVAYDYGDLDELSLAYVLSIHKSQGSEFPCVVIPLHTQHYLMLQRNLLYTAITRGKRLVVVVGTKQALAMAVRRADTGQRHTTLKKRLQESQQLV